MKKIIGLILLVLISSASYAICPTNWINGFTESSYGNDFFLKITYEFRLNDNCEIEVRNLTVSIHGADTCKNKAIFDPYVYSYAKNIALNEIVNNAEQNYGLIIPPCTSSEIYTIVKLKRVVCMRGVNIAPQPGIPPYYGYMEIQECPNSIGICQEVYRLCKNTRQNGSTYNDILLLTVSTTGNSDCPLVPSYENVIWYNELNIQMPYNPNINMHTSCYIWQNCGN